jgi:hypothetical protein
MPEPALRARGGPATPAELAGLHRIQSRRKLAWILLPATIPILYLASLVSAAAVPFICILALLAFGAAIVRHFLCRCPRCGELFNVTKVRGHIWASECAHCALPLRAPP